MFSLDVSRFTFHVSRPWSGDVSAFRWAVVIFATMRISLSLIAALALYQFPLTPGSLEHYHGVQPVPSGIANYLLGVWQRADTLWYSKIAMNGYSPGDGSTVFFPLYPLLMRLLGRYLFSGNYLLAGIFVSNIAYLFALVYLYKLTELEFAPEVALRAIVYLSAFPTAFFFLSAYPESLFLLFAVSSFYYARRGKWLVASIMGLLAALTKQFGLLLFFPLLYEYMVEKEFKISAIRCDVLFIFLIPMGALAFLLFRHFCVGDALLITETYRTTWKVQVSWPWNNIFDSLMSIFDTGRFLPRNLEDTLVRRIFYNSFDLACVGLFILLSLFSLRRLRFGYSLYMGAVLFVVLLQNYRPPYPIIVLPRSVLVLFPGFMVLGSMVRNRVLHWAIMYFWTMLLSLFTIVSVAWRVVA